MAIKSTISNDCKPNEELYFPILMKSTDSSLVLMFTEEGKGFVVSPDDKYGVGHYEDKWLSCYNTAVWEKLEGKITLENK